MALVTQIAKQRRPECDGAEAGEAFDPAKAPHDRSHLHDLISDKIETARMSVPDRLGLLFPTHIEKGGLRNGTIVRDGIDALVRAAEELIEDILRELGPHSRSPELIQGVRDGVVRFIEFLDAELDRFAHRVETEIECTKGPHGIVVPARKLWSEARNTLIDRLEHRIENPCEDEDRAFEALTETNERAEFESPSPQDDAPTPGFALKAEFSSSEPDVSMRSLALEGQPVGRVRFGPEPTPVADVQTSPRADGDWCDAWADLIVEVCNGRAKPRKQSEWREAFHEVCSRRQIDPDPVLLDEWSHLVWRKLITSRFLLSNVQKDIQREAELAASSEDHWPAFHFAAPVSAGSGGSLGARPTDGGSAGRFNLDWARADATSTDAAGDLATAIGLSVPVARLDY